MYIDRKFDPHLIKLQGLPFIYRSSIERVLPIHTPGIYILTGGRQIGKSTLLKLIILRLLAEEGIAPEQIYYLPCDTIADFKQLLFEIEQFRTTLKSTKPFFLFIDEITYVSEWDRTIKHLADTGFFQWGCTVITGSDAIILKEAMSRFPGRRGKAEKQDFHLYPLSFFEYTALHEKELAEHFIEARQRFAANMHIPTVDKKKSSKLTGHFEKYLLTGGFITAINDLAANNLISETTYNIYIQWILGDMLKRNKQELYLREIITALIPRIAKQITWHNITDAMSIEHHQTVIDYLNILERMDIVTIQHALREDKLQPAIKKAKKVNFCDPFIFHAMHGWIKNETKKFGLAIRICEESSDLINSLIEGCLVSLFKRNSDVYYLKAEGEVDIALLKEKSFFPIEVKRSLSINKKELKQILKYKRGIIAYSGLEPGRFEHLDAVPIPLLAMLAA